MKLTSKIFALVLIVTLCITSMLSLPVFGQNQKIRIGFLIHDLVAERWKIDMDNFSNKVEQLGGLPIVKNAYGNAATQVAQGKLLIDEGVKVIAVIAQDATILAELVHYAKKSGAIIIAYDRLIINCDLLYYISFNSIKVGEHMADYVLKLKPKGNYIILKGPSSDNNALLVKQGIMNKLKTAIDKGDVKILMEKEIDSWYALSSLMAIDDFLDSNKEPIDVIIASSDDLAAGAIDAFKAAKLPMPIITGQDASVEACRNIIMSYQSMTVYKSIKKLSNEAAILAMKVARGEKITGTIMLNNGKRDVPSILFDPVVVDKTNLKQTVIGEGQIKESDLN